MIMAWWDREGWLNFMFWADGRVERRWRKSSWELGIERFSCTTQTNIPDTAGTTPYSVGNDTKTSLSKPNQARCTCDFSYPFVSSILFSSLSPISYFSVHNSIMFAENKVKSFLSICPCHDHDSTPSTALHRVQHVPSAAYIEHRAQHICIIVCPSFILMITTCPLNVASVSGVPHDWSTAICQLSIRDSKVKSTYHIRKFLR